MDDYIMSAYCIYNEREKEKQTKKQTNKQFMNMQTDNETAHRRCLVFCGTGGDVRELVCTS